MTVTSTLSKEEAERLRREFERNIRALGQRVPGIMALGEGEKRPQPKGFLSIIGVQASDIQSTLRRIWGPETPDIELKGFDRHWKPDKAHIALITTNRGDKVLKAEKKETGQEGTVNEGLAQVFYAELNLNSIRMGVGGLKQR
jgi:hypothetical protein